MSFDDRVVPTYETATTRKYYNGRTETMRSCTVEALEWCKVMLDPLATVSRLLESHRISMSNSKEMHFERDN